LGDAWRDVEGLAMADDGSLYAAVHGANDESSLFKINVATGTALEIGPMGFAEVDGLAWRFGELYAVTSRFGGYNARLLKVDPATGKAQPIGAALPLGDLDSLTFDDRGRLLTTDGMGLDDKIYQLDREGIAPPKSLAATPPIIKNSRDIEGLALASDGKLYGVTHPNPEDQGPNRSYLVRIDPDTFEYANLGLLDAGTLCLAAGHLIPEIGTQLKLCLIPAGEFEMGTAVEDVEEIKAAENWFFADFVSGRREAETPQHPVTISKPFEMSTHEVTVGQFRQFVAATGHQTTAEQEQEGYGWRNGEWEEGAAFHWQNPGFEQTDDHPVCNVSWDDAVAFCRWLSEEEGVTYRLPTEAEWEYACRAGTATLFSTGDDIDSLQDAANLADATLRREQPGITWAVDWQDGFAATAPVGSFKPNAFGLHDMHGNAWEWCQDVYDDAWYETSPTTDPLRRGSGRHVFRGGGFDNWPGFLRSADRYSSHSPTIYTDWAGFRVVREAAEENSRTLPR
jgi:formylglycine-generating enzyme required for sulfatase activity